jgi:hypothetical protein
MVRDQEIERLVHYAKGLGVEVVFSKKDSGDSSAQWALDGSQITIFVNKQDSKTDMILSLIHEIGHHVWFIHEKNRQPDLKFDEAISIQNLVETEDRDRPTPKKLRKKIYEVELASSYWWETIYKETNMKFPIWKLYAQREFDVWVYEHFYKTGHFPSTAERREKWKTIREKHKPKKQS